LNANEKQIAGDHYKKYGDLQPWDVVIKWNLGYLEGTALKYIARWRDKGGIDDIKKAIHFLEKLVEIHSPTANYPTTSTGIVTQREGQRSVSVDLYSGERSYNSPSSSQQFRDSDYPLSTSGALEEWIKWCKSQKALDEYHARDV
jgi:hypothetical protein